MTHRERVDALVRAFVAQAPPPPDAGHAGADFALFAAARGAPVRIVHARDGEHPVHAGRDWVRVLNVDGIHGYDVDFGAAQFGDPELPVPLVWRMDGQHPVTGVYRTMTVAPAVPAGDRR